MTNLPGTTLTAVNAWLNTDSAYTGWTITRTPSGQVATRYAGETGEGELRSLPHTLVEGEQFRVQANAGESYLMEPPALTFGGVITEAQDGTAVAGAGALDTPIYAATASFAALENLYITGITLPQGEWQAGTTAELFSGGALVARGTLGEGTQTLTLDTTAFIPQSFDVLVVVRRPAGAPALGGTLATMPAMTYQHLELIDPGTLRVAQNEQEASESSDAWPPVSAYPTLQFVLGLPEQASIAGPLGSSQVVSDVAWVQRGQIALLVAPTQPPRWVFMDASGRVWYGPSWSATP